MTRGFLMLSLLAALGGAAHGAEDEVLVGRDRGDCPDRSVEVSWELKGEVTVGQALKVLGQLVCERYLISKEMMKTRVTLGVPNEKVPLSELRYRVEAAFRANGITLRSDTVYRPIREERRADVLATPPPRIPTPLDEEMERSIHCTENRCELTHALFDKILGDMNTLSRGARIVPSIKDGRPDGFKLYAIRPGSFFARIGLTNGDTIQTINGMDITSPDRALEVYSKVRTANSITVTLTRRGQPMTKEYVIK